MYESQIFWVLLLRFCASAPHPLCAAAILPLCACALLHLADGFTKCLPAQKFEKFIVQLRLQLLPSAAVLAREL